MGHLRLGRLPKTRPWSDVFEVLESDSVSLAALAGAVVKAAQQQFAVLEGDQAVNYCFWVLVRLATAARGNDFAEELRRLGVQNTSITSGLGFVQQITHMVERELRKRGQSTVFARIAELSLREVLSAHIIEQSRTLFGTNFEDIQAACRAISTRLRFGEVAREFFAHLSSESHAMDQLHDFVRRRREAREPVEDFDRFEQELHRLFVMAEREALGHELARFDLDVPQVEVERERYDRVLRCETTYNSAAMRGRVVRTIELIITVTGEG